MALAAGQHTDGVALRLAAVEHATGRAGAVITTASAVDGAVGRGLRISLKRSSGGLDPRQPRLRVGHPARRRCANKMRHVISGAVASR